MNINTHSYLLDHINHVFLSFSCYSCFKFSNHLYPKYSATPYHNSTYLSYLLTICLCNINPYIHPSKRETTFRSRQHVPTSGVGERKEQINYLFSLF